MTQVVALMRSLAFATALVVCGCFPGEDQTNDERRQDETSVASSPGLDKESGVEEDGVVVGDINKRTQPRKN